MKSIIQFAERRPAPSLLPILRSQQQGEILALLLGDPAPELSLTEITARTGVPQPSVHREIERADASGSKYCAECHVRLNRSDVGFAKAGMHDLFSGGDKSGSSPAS